MRDDEACRPVKSEGSVKSPSTGRRLAGDMLALLTSDAGDRQWEGRDASDGLALLESLRPRRRPEADRGHHGRHGEEASAARRQRHLEVALRPRLLRRRPRRQLAAVRLARRRQVHVPHRQRAADRQPRPLPRLHPHDEPRALARADGGLVPQQLHLQGPLRQRQGPRRDGSQVLPGRRRRAHRVWLRLGEARRLRRAARPRPVGQPDERLGPRDHDRELPLGRHDAERDVVPVELLPHVGRRRARRTPRNSAQFGGAIFAAIF